MNGPKRIWPIYEERGWNEHDGLGEGHWVTVPGSAGIRRWVGEIEKKPEPARRCIDCSVAINSRATRCRRHASIVARAAGKQGTNAA